MGQPSLLKVSKTIQAQQKLQWLSLLFHGSSHNPVLDPPHLGRRIAICSLPGDVIKFLFSVWKAPPSSMTCWLLLLMTKYTDADVDVWNQWTSSLKPSVQLPKHITWVPFLFYTIYQSDNLWGWSASLALDKCMQIWCTTNHINRRHSQFPQYKNVIGKKLPPCKYILQLLTASLQSWWFAWFVIFVALVDNIIVFDTVLLFLFAVLVVYVCGC